MKRQPDEDENTAKCQYSRGTATPITCFQKYMLQCSHKGSHAQNCSLQCKAHEETALVCEDNLQGKFDAANSSTRVPT